MEVTKMKDFLTNLIQRKRAEMEELKKRSDESNDLSEVRAIGDMLAKLRDEITEAEDQLKKLDEEDSNDESDEGNDEGADESASRSSIPETAELRNAQVISTFGGNKTMDNENMEYRQAFMSYILRGVAIPTELRDNENTTTKDVAIPTILVNRIVEKMDAVGGIISEVTRTSYKGGVAIPTSSVKPVAAWVGTVSNPTGEGLGSNRQKKTTINLTFSYHKLRCEISMSMEVSVMALSAFEAKFVENVAKAMVKAIELAIIDGDGTNQPTGILRETPVDGQAITGSISYAKLVECESAVPEEYESGAKWCMTKGDFFKFIGMVDDNGQPIARVTYGINGKPERVLLGRGVIISAQAKSGTPFIFDFSDYILNTIYDMGISKKQDWDTEDLLTKAVMSVDGKVVDKGSLVTFAYTPAV